MLRYVDWKNRGQVRSVGAPNTCTMDFIDEINNSGAFFARKFDKKIDSAIVDYYSSMLFFCLWNCKTVGKHSIKGLFRNGTRKWSNACRHGTICYFKVSR